MWHHDRLLRILQQEPGQGPRCHIPHQLSGQTDTRFVICHDALHVTLKCYWRLVNALGAFKDAPSEGPPKARKVGALRRPLGQMMSTANPHGPGGPFWEALLVAQRVKLRRFAAIIHKVKLIHVPGFILDLQELWCCLAKARVELLEPQVLWLLSPTLACVPPRDQRRVTCRRGRRQAIAMQLRIGQGGDVAGDGEELLGDQ